MDITSELQREPCFCGIKRVPEAWFYIVVKASQSQTDLSLLVCTYNRCEDLRELLDSAVSQQTEAKFTFDIIVVDNNRRMIAQLPLLGSSLPQVAPKSTTYSKADKVSHML